MEAVGIEPYARRYANPKRTLGFSAYRCHPQATRPLTGVPCSTLESSCLPWALVTSVKRRPLSSSKLRVVDSSWRDGRHPSVRARLGQHVAAAHGEIRGAAGAIYLSALRKWPVTRTRSAPTIWTHRGKTCVSGLLDGLGLRSMRCRGSCLSKVGAIAPHRKQDARELSRQGHCGDALASPERNSIGPRAKRFGVGALASED